MDSRYFRFDIVATQLQNVGCRYIYFVVKMKVSSFETELEIQVESKYRFGEVVPELDIRSNFWSYGDYVLVGHGKQTNAECGKFKRFDGCLNVVAHNAAR